MLLGLGKQSPVGSSVLEVGRGVDTYFPNSRQLRVKAREDPGQNKPGWPGSLGVTSGVSIAWWSLWGHLSPGAYGAISPVCCCPRISLKTDHLPSQIPGRCQLCYTHWMKMSLLSAVNLVSVIDLYNVQRLCAYNQPKVMHHL